MSHGLRASTTTAKTPTPKRTTDDALKDANEAIRLAPTYSFVFRGRANVYNDMGKYDLAVHDYDQRDPTGSQ